MLPALILAAGESTRMGTPKALLPDADGRSFVARIARSLRAAGLADVIVVTGSQHDAIAAALTADHLDWVRVVQNPDPSRGQLSSLWCGLDACPGAEALVMTLVDVPLVSTATIAQVVEAWRRTRAPIVRPFCEGRRGHPVVFDERLFEELRAAPLEEGARVVVRAHWGDSLDVPVDDRGCLIDVDTPADYQRLHRGQTRR